MVVPESLKNATVLLLSICACLAIAEASIRWFIPRAQFLRPTTDAYWILQQSPTPAPTSGVADIALDENIGWRMKPNFVGVGVHHNSVGFRSTYDYTLTSRLPRVFAVGDSFTYGFGVRDEETFAALLQRDTGMEVINAGVNAYGADQALLMWELEGVKYSPSVVVLSYFVDDFHRNGLAVRDWKKPQFVYDSATHQFDLRSAAQSSEKITSILTDSLGAMGVLQAAEWTWHRARTKMGLIDKEDLLRKARVSQFILARLKESVTQAGARLLVVFIGHRYDGSPEHRWIENTVIQSCRSNNIECINLAAAMRGVESAQYFGSNGHFSALGHRFAAEAIAHALSRTPHTPP